MGASAGVGRRGGGTLDGLAVLAGAVVLLWPAIINRYPIVFSDTAAFIEQAMGAERPWDKPFAYGPLMLGLDFSLSLWGVVIAQAVLLSWLLFRLAPSRHVLLCAALALLTPLPWFVSLVMPDVFAAVPILCAVLIARRAAPYGLLAAVMTVAILVHLTHLIVAAACVGVLALAWRWRDAIRTALPMVVAAALLIGSNAILYNRPGISPYGSVFLLARLVADGPARDELAAACPGAGYDLCRWLLPGKTLPTDSDAFLWDGDGPSWEQDDGPPALAAEASAINLATLLHRPEAVARTMALNTWRQATMVDVGDATGPAYLPSTVGYRLLQHFPAAELTRFQDGRQVWDGLTRFATPFLWVHRLALALAALGCVAALIPRRTRLFAALVLAGVAGNAFATGALSGPHARYQSRIAWVLVLPGLALVAAGSDVRQPTRVIPALRQRDATPAPRSRPPAFP